MNFKMIIYARNTFDIRFSNKGFPHFKNEKKLTNY